MRNWSGRLLLSTLALLVPACGGGGGGGGGGGSGGGGNVIVTSNQPPMVFLRRPAANAGFAPGSAVLLEADASDPDGSVTKVEFFDGPTRIAAVTGPFTFTWTGAATGAHSITAVATDNLGATTVSLPVPISVTDGGGTLLNQPPTVSLVSPLSGTLFTEGTPIRVEAVAEDLEGPVARVDFFDGGTPIGSVRESPWRISWSGAGPGTHSLHAVATDQGNASTSSAPVEIAVTPLTIGGGPGSSPPQGKLQGVFFADSSRGWTVGVQGIWATTDGGTTWTQQTSGTTAVLNRVQFVNATQGWAVGTAGTVLRTVDGGAHWDPMSSGTSNDLTGLSFVTSAIGYVVSAQGTVHRTVDGGASWAVLDAGESGAFLGAVSFVNSTQGWIGGSDAAATGDGGMTWVHHATEFQSFTGVPHIPTFLDARFVSVSQGTFVGNHRGGDVIFTTKNGGATWTIVQPHTSFASLQGVAFGDGNHFWAVGGFGQFSDRTGAIILASTDGGVTWTDQVSPTSQTLNGVWFVSGSTGWAVGDNGVVIRTTNGGVTWVLLTPGS